jgi:TolQ protein
MADQPSAAVPLPGAVDPAALGATPPLPGVVDPAALAAAPPVHDLSMVSLFMQADPIVKGVMVLLILCSVVAWTIIIDRWFRLARLRRLVKAFDAAAARGIPAPEHVTGRLPSSVLAAGREAWADRSDDESRADARERIERAMRAAAAIELRKLETGLPFLATVGSAAPFVGLFGTVWGIMNSFTSIAQSNDTSLAVVAPGIAEALFATAIGLVAAIPAVIGYNKLSVDLGRISQGVNAVIARIGNLMARGISLKSARAAE